MGIKNNIQSDVAPLTQMINNLIQNNIPINGLRDITRGGLATALNEIALDCGLKANIFEADIPVSDKVDGLCRILGLDPLYMANEGKMLAIIPGKFAKVACNIMKNSQHGENTRIIGNFQPGSGIVLNTKLGGLRKLPPLSGEGLPRIC
jgi:hydrogenase expression/formation protein HypE